MDEQASPATLPQQERDWHLVVMPRTLNGQDLKLNMPDDVELWMIIDIEAGQLREMTYLRTATRLESLLRLVVSAMVEPRPPGAPARPRRLRIPDEPHPRRDVHLDQQTQAALAWSLRALDVKVARNDELADLKATSAAMQAMSQTASGVLTGAPFEEQALCAALHRLAALGAWLGPHMMLEFSRVDGAPLVYSMVGLKEDDVRYVVCYQSLAQAGEMEGRMRRGAGPQIINDYDLALAELYTTATVNETLYDKLRGAGVLDEAEAWWPRFRRFGPTSEDQGILDQRRCEGVLFALETMVAFYERYPPDVLSALDETLLDVVCEVRGARVRVNELSLAMIDAIADAPASSDGAPTRVDSAPAPGSRDGAPTRVDSAVERAGDAVAGGDDEPERGG